MSQKSVLVAAGYIPAVLRHNTNGWYIEYYQFNPILNFMERRRLRVTNLRKHCSSLAEFKMQAQNMLNLINNELMSGALQMNQPIVPSVQMAGIPNYPLTATPAPAAPTLAPQVQQNIQQYQPVTESVRYYMTIPEVYDKFLKEKEKETKKATFNSYKSCSRLFKNWLATRCPDCKCVLFTKELAVEYLDYGVEHGWSNNTCNNNLKQLRVFFSWMLEKCYVKENVFATIKARKKEEKKRTLATAEYRKTIRKYFEEHCPGYLLVAELVFNALIRPVEISRITVSMVDLENKVIHLPKELTKTGYARDAVLSDELLNILRPNLHEAKPEWALIGEGYKPGPVALVSSRYTKTWAKMRKACEIPETVQLYSLRDSGLTGLFDNGADANTVKGAADHHDLAITSTYCNHVDTGLVDKVRKFTPTF